MQDLFIEIKTVSFLEDYFRGEKWYLVTRDLKDILNTNINGQNKKVENTIITGNVFIGENTIIGPYSVIEGPAYIGDNVEIGANVHIRSGSVVGNGCVVGYGAGVKNSIMMDNSKISNHSFIGDSILGVKSRVGGHSETGNRRFDQGEIFWNFESGKVETGLDKLGLILGEGSRIGGSVITAPGTVIGRNTFVVSGASISGYIPANKFVRTKIELDIRDNNFDKELNQNSTLA